MESQFEDVIYFAVDFGSYLLRRVSNFPLDSSRNDITCSCRIQTAVYALAQQIIIVLKENNFQCHSCQVLFDGCNSVMECETLRQCPLLKTLLRGIKL